MLSLFLFEALYFKGKFVIGLLQKSDFASTVLNILAAIEDGLFELCDDVLVFSDLLDVLGLDRGLLAFNLFVFALELDDFQAKVVELFLHFLTLVQLLPQFSNRLIFLDCFNKG